MRQSLRKLTGSLVLSVYGSVAVLGYGLHELSAVDHHHELCAAAHGDHHHAGPCSGHDHDHEESAPAHDGPSLADAHDCDICVFLAHAVGQPPQPAAMVVRDHFVADAVISATQYPAQVALGLHAPRGPPLLAT